MARTRTKSPSPATIRCLREAAQASVDARQAVMDFYDAHEGQPWSEADVAEYERLKVAHRRADAQTLSWAHAAYANPRMADRPQPVMADAARAGG